MSGSEQGRKDRLLTPGEVAELFRVDPKTVARWAQMHKLSSIRTPGGHRRFRESEIEELVNADQDLDALDEQESDDPPN